MRIASSLALFSLVAGCGGPSHATDAGTDAPSTIDAALDAGRDGGLGRRDGGGCLEATVTTWAMETYDDVMVVYRARIAPEVGGEPFDLFLESRTFTSPSFVGTFPLGGADADGNYGTCAHCVVAFTGSMFEHGFFASSGTLVLDASPFDLALSGSLDDVTLTEVAIGPDLTSTPVTGGDCIHLSHVDLDQTFGPPGWTCPIEAFEDGTTCDCDCGILDRDCTDTTLPIARCAAGQLCLPLARGIIGPFFGDSVCANRCDRDAGTACPTGEACVDHAFGDVCIADATEIDRSADLGELCVDGALYCAIDAMGFSNGYCDLYERGDRQCRPRCSLDSDCDEAAFEHCYVVTYETSGTAEIPRGYCAPRFPAEWTCGGATFGEGTTCDCDCGAHDRDCDDGALPIAGCATGETCSGGRCEAAP